MYGESPIVTIGITNYNGENHMDKCINSILNQTFKDVEILIADYSASDKLKNILKEYKDINKNIRVFYNTEKSGQDNPICEIIKNSHGKYLMLLNSGDYPASSTCIEDFVREFNNCPETDYIYCSIKIVDDDGSEISILKYRQYSRNEIIFGAFTSAGSEIFPLKGMFKRSFLVKNYICLEENQPSDTLLTALISVKHRCCFKFLDKELLCVGQYPRSFPLDIRRKLKSIIQTLDYIVNNFSEEIYFPKTDWAEYAANDRECIKNYLIGEFYYVIFKNYYYDMLRHQVNNMCPESNFDFFMPLKIKILDYLNRSSSAGDIFNEKIEKIKANLEVLL